MTAIKKANTLVILAASVFLAGCSVLAKEAPRTVVVSPTAPRFEATATATALPPALATDIQGFKEEIRKLVETATPTETETATPTETETATPTEIVTLYKSEKYPWSGGIDVSRATMKGGRFVLVDEVAWKKGYSGADLITENIILAYAIQKGLTLDQYVDYLSKNDYKDTVTMFETDLPAMHLKEVNIDFSRPMVIAVDDEPLNHGRSFAMRLGIDPSDPVVGRWTEIFVDKNGTFVFCIKRSLTSYAWLKTEKKLIYPVYLLNHALELVTHLHELNGRSGEDLLGTVYNLSEDNPGTGMTKNLGEELFFGLSVAEISNYDLALKNSPMIFVEEPWRQ